MGKVVDLLRVPDERVGSNRWGGAAGQVGDVSKQLSTMQETAITGYALAVGRARGGLGRGKLYTRVDSI